MRQLLPLCLAVMSLLSFEGVARGNDVWADIGRQFEPSQLTSLNLGNTEIPVISHPADAVLSRGVAMMLVDNGYQGLTLSAALQLARRMNEWGWHTRIVVLPLSIAHPEPVNASIASSSASQLQSWVNYEGSQEQLRALLKALFEQSNSVHGLKVLITQGMTATQYLALSKNAEVPVPDSLVTIAPYWPEQKVNQEISDMLANTEYPVLDLRLTRMNHWESQTARPRQLAAKRALKLHYRQRTVQDNGLPVASLDGFSSPLSNWLSKEIYGWIRYLGW
ncbi:DUF3530 family protein [Alteromonas aestuariivivens]|nr:DUF3530 family protein [Alteromonas aestuariivivens]